MSNDVVGDMKWNILSAVPNFARTQFIANGIQTNIVAGHYEKIS